MFESKSSAISYTNTFLAHWSSVDTHIGAGPVFNLPVKPGVIPPGFNRSGLTALRDFLESNLDSVQAQLNVLQTNSRAIELKKALLLNRLRLFLEVVDGYYTETALFGSRPDMPSINAGEEKFREPFRDAKNMWASMNTSPAPSGITLPVTVNEGTINTPAVVTQAQFAAAMLELQGLYEARAQARLDLATARARRDKTIADIYAILLCYRSAVLPRISTNQPLIDTLPRLSPEPGHTPDPVTVQATLTSPETATGTHTASEEATFASYEVLGAAGADADLDDAVILYTRTNRVPEPFTVTLGLAEPGGAVTLWVRVVLETGNHRTSERVVVLRP